MQLSAFSSSGKFWRGNIHTHSTNSDGILPPYEVCRRYMAEGYDFIALTDHFVGIYDYPISDTREFRDEKFTTILGAEVHSGSMENGELWHLLAVGLPIDFEPSNSPNFHPIKDQETGPELALRAREAGAYVAIAHPQWSGITLNDARSIEAAHAVEVYNHGCEVGCDRADGFHTLELLLSEGKQLNLCATDDAHFSSPDHFGGWVMVKADNNEEANLVQALKAGDYYSTQGPALEDIRIEGDKLIINCSPASTIIAQGYGSAAIARHGENLTSVTLDLARFSRSPWLRVSIVDSYGKKAWSNPFWTSEYLGA